MVDAIAKGTLVRFTRKVSRYIRDMDFSQTEKQHEVPLGTVGIVLGEAEGTWNTNKAQKVKRPVIFTSLGFRVCEVPENLEVLAGPPKEVLCPL